MAAAPATPAAEALAGALADRPGATATELAQAAGIGRSTAAKLLATLAGQGRVLRQPGGLKDGRRAADRWTLPPPSPTQDSSAPPTAAPMPAQPTRPRPPSGAAGAPASCASWCWAAWPSGQDRRCHPPRSPRRLDRSAGAVANALQVLAGQGAVTQTQPKPRRYTIAAAGGDQTDAQR